jgi:AcrR family transcriptional regulator
MLKSRGKKWRRAPTQARSKATVDAIIEAAARVIDSDGMEAATTTRIAEVAGVGIGTLYDYFADKEALSRAVLERCARRKLERLVEEIPSLTPLSARDAMRRLLEIYVELVASQCDLTRALLGRAVYTPADEEPDEIAQGFADLIRGQLLLRRKALRPIADIDMTTLLLVSVLNGTIEAAVLNKPEYLRDPLFLDELTTLVGRFILPDS